MRKLFLYGGVFLVLLLSGCSGGGGDGGGSGTGDVTAPVVSSFTMPATATSLTVPVTAFTATDATGVTGYMISTSATPPSSSAATWSASAPTSFIFPAAGSQTAYAWAKDAAGNVSASMSATVTITISSTVAKPVQGTATDPTTGTPLTGATVSAFVQSAGSVPKRVAAAAFRTTTTDANGNFFFTDLAAGTTYYLEISKPGYANYLYYDVIPDANSNLTLESSRVIPSTVASQTATVSGRVKNASTNAALPNMTVRIRTGVNNKTGTLVATQTTDSLGVYAFTNLAAGSYTAEVTGTIGTTPIVTSYFTLISVPGNTALNTNQDFPVTAGTTGSGQYRIVLNWGNNPSDLDSHLTGPTATATRFHTAFYADDYPSGSTTTQTIGSQEYRVAGPNTEAFLDVDNTSHGTDNGPETTTIVVPRTGAYKFYVHHWSGSSTISTSGAQVKVYQGTTLLATYNPPSGAVGSNDVWAVFSMDVTATGQTITPVNRIFVNVGTDSLDSLTGGSGGTFTNSLTVGSGFDGTDITGVGTSFSLAATGGGTLYARIESAATFGTKFARLYINNGTYAQKDYCTTCNSQPLLNGTNVKVGQFRITDTGTFSLKAVAVETVVDIGVETQLGTVSVTMAP
jgi:hypothetical protein